jgi:hypothetical protein
MIWIASEPPDDAVLFQALPPHTWLLWHAETPIIFNGNSGTDGTFSMIPLTNQSQTQFVVGR